MPPIKKKKLVVEKSVMEPEIPLAKPGYTSIMKLPLASLFQHIGRECRIRGLRCQLIEVRPSKQGFEIQYLRLPRDNMLRYGEASHLYHTQLRVAFSPGSGLSFEHPCEFELLMDFKPSI